ncbi:hypothetical protein [Paractinoplanes durhamensis]|uniref:Glycosyltransferase RgtA/B/C/D-like domain-containing protein n=1 Tax=Paractinoplanes durhamensis TaxID=113563 RepID=A0ABQ3Z1M1_9ACTN|nr:hypothetical protein [Actinoplanes durhamensis]GIE03718.1 hypothetical protein Adu01nite_50680 [Actinoplanes durhamensis]
MGRVRLAERVHQAHDDRVLSFRRFNLRWAPWCLPAAALLLGLLLTDVPLLDIVRYAAYFGLAVLLPGTLVHRALRGSRGNLPEDLGLGGATGLLLLLIGWAATAATGLQAFLPAWPAAIVVLFLAVPRLRGHWLIADRRPVPLRWTWVLAGTMTLVVASLVPFWHNQLLPPAQDVWFQDLGYHLALVHEMTRSMPFQVPQLAGETLRYHYLSDADMAAASMLTGIDPIVVLLRLWLAPIAAITVLVVTALARDLTGGKWWAAVLAAAAGVTGLPLLAWAQGSNPISYYSPSQVYMLPLTGLLLTLAVPAVRGRGLGWAWLLVFPLALACAGAKSSALPPVVFGLIVATGTTLGRRERRRPALTMLGLTLAAMLVGTFLFAGGGAGTLSLQPFAVLLGFVPYRQTLGAADVNDGTLRLPDGVAHLSAGGFLFLAALVLWWLLVQAPRLAGLVTLAGARNRRDPAVWLLAGLTVAGVGGMWLLWHPSLSQTYFYLGMIPFATVLTVRLLADRQPGQRLLLGGLAAGFLATGIAARLPFAGVRGMAAWAWQLYWPAAFVLAVIVLLSVLVIRRRGLPIVLTAALLGGSVGVFAERAAEADWKALRDQGRHTSRLLILQDEMVAAQWVDRHAGPDDVVATNVHCWPPGGPAAGCDSRAFWVAALTGRRTLIESWGYTDAAVAADGDGGLRYYRQPPPDPARYALNQRVFELGAAADLAELRDRYHVRWLLADVRSGPVGLAAAPVFTAGPVTIYELR